MVKFLPEPASSNMETATFTLKEGTVPCNSWYSFSVDGGPWRGLYSTHAMAYNRAMCGLGAHAVVNEPKRFKGVEVWEAAKIKLAEGSSIRVARAINPTLVGSDRQYRFVLVVT